MLTTPLFNRINYHLPWHNEQDSKSDYGLMQQWGLKGARTCRFFSHWHQKENEKDEDLPFKSETITHRAPSLTVIVQMKVGSRFSDSDTILLLCYCNMSRTGMRVEIGNSTRKALS